MAQAKFILNNFPTIIQCDKKEKMKTFIDKFSSKIGEDISSLFFFYNGKMLNENLTFDELANSIDKQTGQMSILAEYKNNEEDNVNINIKFKNKNSSNNIFELKSEIKKLKYENEMKDNKLKELQKKIDKLESELNNERIKNNNLNDIINNLKISKLKFTIRSKCDSYKCLTMKNLEYGNSTYLWEYNYNNAKQIFELEKNNDSTYSIKSSNSGLYLGFDSDNISFRRKNENKQSFYLYHFDDGYYLFQEKNGGVIDLYDRETYNGKKIGKWSRHNGSNQQWLLVVHN